MKNRGVYANGGNAWGHQKEANSFILDKWEIEQRPSLPLLYIFLAVDTLDLLLLMLDMTDSVPLRMVHAGRPQEQSEEECQDDKALHRVQTKPPTKRPEKLWLTIRQTFFCLPNWYSVHNGEDKDTKARTRQNKHLRQLSPIPEVLTNHQTCSLSHHATPHSKQ